MAVKVGVVVGVKDWVGVGLQPARVVVTELEDTLFSGVVPFNSPWFTRFNPQLLTVPTRVSAPLAPAARFPSVHTTCCPVTAGKPLAEL